MSVFIYFTWGIYPLPRVGEKTIGIIFVHVSYVTLISSIEICTTASDEPFSYHNERESLECISISPLIQENM